MFKSLLNSSFKSTFYSQLRNKYRGSKPRPAILQRRILEQISKPFSLEDLEGDPSKDCSVSKYRKEAELCQQKNKYKEDLYRIFLNEQLEKDLEGVKVVTVCQMDSMGSNNLRELKNSLLDINFHIFVYPHQVIESYFSSSRFLHLLPLVNKHVCLVTSCNYDNIKSLTNFFKKNPSLHLLGGVIENQVFTRKGFLDFVALPTLEQMRGQLIVTLQTLPQQLISNLKREQTKLLCSLKQYGEENK